MRRIAAALASLVGAALPALANDTSAELATGRLLFVQNDNVEMRSEDLAISNFLPENDLAVLILKKMGK